LVRDQNKQKMSKSKGNIIDPLELSTKYGTDALRIGLIFSTAAGNDIPLSEDKIRGMKFFTNKLWNIARFIDMQRQQLAISHAEAKTLTELKALCRTDRDTELIDKLQKLIASVEGGIASFRLHEAAQSLYHFIWHEYADVYLEDVKGRMDANTFGLLWGSFIILLKLTHPFMPFVTEEIWNKFKNEKDLPMIASPWPASA